MTNQSHPNSTPADKPVETHQIVGRIIGIIIVSLVALNLAPVWFR